MNRESILSSLKQPSQLVPFDVSEWSCTVYFRPNTLAETQHLNEKIKKLKGTESEKTIQIIQITLAQCILDENGERVFTDDADIEMLMSLPLPTLRRLINKLNEIN